MKKRRIISIFVALLLLFTYCTGGITEVSAATVKNSNGFKYQYDKASHGIKLLKYTGTETVIHVPKKIDGKPVTVIGEKCFKSKKKITSVTLPDTIETIEGSAFLNCSTLRNILLSSKLKKIGAYAFKGCKSLRTIKFPGKLEEVGEYAFADCMSLAGIKNMGAITELKQGTFSGCSGLVAIVFQYTKLKKIGQGVFTGCTELKSIRLPASITTLESGAFDKSGFQTIVFEPDAGITKIPDGCFTNCFNLKEVDIPKNVTSIGKEIFACNNGEKPAGVEKINILGGSVKTLGEDSLKGISSNAFIVVPSKYKAAYTELFLGQSWYEPTMQVLTAKELSKEPETFVDKENGFKYQYDKASHGVKLLKYTGKEKIVTVPKKIDGKPVTVIGKECFKDKKEIKEIVLPKGLKTIEYGAFWNCHKLVKITLPKGLKTIGNYAFWYCFGLVEISIPDTVKTIGECVFADCYSLKKVRLPKNMTVLPDGMFSECRNLKSIKLPSKLKVIDDYAFDGCSSLTQITLPASVTVLGYGSFMYCEKLKKITIPKNTKLQRIKQSAFAYCFKLKSIRLPASIETLDGAAFDRSYFEKISFAPNAKITKIPDECFADCPNLVEFDIPQNVTAIGDELFAINDMEIGPNWPSVKKINIMGGKIETVGIEFMEGVRSNVVINVPPEYEEKYKELFQKQPGYQPTMQIRSDAQLIIKR